MSEGVKPTTGFWIISILALLWNLMGVANYLGSTMIEPAAFLETQGQAFVDILEGKPAWATASFAIAVFAGVLGCLGLLLRKSWSRILFVISLLGVIAHTAWGFMSGMFNISSSVDKGLTVLIILVAIFLIWFSGRMSAQGVLR